MNIIFLYWDAEPEAAEKDLDFTVPVDAPAFCSDEEETSDSSYPTFKMDESSDSEVITDKVTILKDDDSESSTIFSCIFPRW